MNTLLAWDETLYRCINQCGTWHSLDLLFTTLSSSTFWWGFGLAVTVALVLLKKRDWLIQWVLALACLGITDLSATYAIKETVQRARPCYALKNPRLISGCGGPFGFPSNHAANAMAVATTVAAKLPFPQGALAVGLASLVGLSRIYLGVHYPGDVLGGFALGACLAWILRALWKRVCIRRLNATTTARP